MTRALTGSPLIAVTLYLLLSTAVQTFKVYEILAGTLVAVIGRLYTSTLPAILATLIGTLATSATMCCDGPPRLILPLAATAPASSTRARDKS